LVAAILILVCEPNDQLLPHRKSIQEIGCGDDHSCESDAIGTNGHACPPFKYHIKLIKTRYR
jgi:hypothetical protein